MSTTHALSRIGDCPCHAWTYPDACAEVPCLSFQHLMHEPCKAAVSTDIGRHGNLSTASHSRFACGSGQTCNACTSVSTCCESVRASP